MARKMLIDATHAEETRVVVVDGTKIDEFDFETASRRQLAGNIYLAKVMRVEPSLQAAFVDYGGNRHGFLAFSEIHPDYYQISAKERAALLDAQERAERARRREEDNAEDTTSRPQKSQRTQRGRYGSRRSARRAPRAAQSRGSRRKRTVSGALIEREFRIQGGVRVRLINEANCVDPKLLEQEILLEDGTAAILLKIPNAADSQLDDAQESVGSEEDTVAETTPLDLGETNDPSSTDEGSDSSTIAANTDIGDSVSSDDNVDELPEAIGGNDEVEEVRAARPIPRYKIQDVIKRRQILLIQVVKEERGTKGAAVTTYLSLAGRYCVLMPNSGKGGGISRKITNASDRKRLKSIASDLEVPKGMGLIIRTAGAQQSDTDIRRDYEYLLRQWEAVRTLTIESFAPALVYEEGSLILRSIRDLYSADISEILVEGAEGHTEASSFMRMIMPENLGSVIEYRDKTPLFVRHQVENQLAGMFNPTVQLKSGGYIVIGVTEALVAIDVNSGRSTRESSIEDTATKTNLEAAEEVARQLKLRDLAGLVVIDFIDMDDRRNNNAVERRLKDRLADDRARIQVGRISSFGLLEMSRQRLRPGMVEATTQECPHCHGTGLVRSDDALALTILRDVEEECVKKRLALMTVAAPVSVANFLLNRKRQRVSDIESRYGIRLVVEGDPSKISPDFELKRFKLDEAPEDLRPAPAALDNDVSDLAEYEEVDAAQDTAPATEPETRDDRDERKNDSRSVRNRRGARRKKPADDPLKVIDIAEAGEAEGDAPFEYGVEKRRANSAENDDRGNNRRSRRGGKGRRRRSEGPEREMAEAAAFSMLVGRDALDRALPRLFSGPEVANTAQPLAAQTVETDTTIQEDVTLLPAAEPTGAEVLPEHSESEVQPASNELASEIPGLEVVDVGRATGLVGDLTEGAASAAIGVETEFTGMETLGTETPDTESFAAETPARQVGDVETNIVAVETTIPESSSPIPDNSTVKVDEVVASTEPSPEPKADPEPVPEPSPPRPKRSGWWSRG